MNKIILIEITDEQTERTDFRLRWNISVPDESAMKNIAWHLTEALKEVLHIESPSKKIFNSLVTKVIKEPDDE